MIAPIAAEVHQADQPPALQLAQARAHIGAGDLERLDDLLGVHRPPGDEEQGVDLRHGPVDAPAGAHFAPMQDEARNGG